VRQNHRIIRIDVCDPVCARNFRRRHIQVATQAESREPVSQSSGQHRFEAADQARNNHYTALYPNVVRRIFSATAADLLPSKSAIFIAPFCSMPPSFHF
jgi:hypothetical protein